MGKQKIGFAGKNSTARYNHQTGVSYNKRRFRPFFASILVVGLTAGLVIKTDILPSFASISHNNQSSASVSDAPSPQATDENISQAASLPKQDTILEEHINTVLTSFPDEQKWSVYVQDLDTKRAVSINADQLYDAGSLSKLFLLAPLETKLTADKWSSRIANTTVKDCVESMLKTADSDCSKSIGYMVNLDYADHFNQSLGYSKTKLNGTAQTTAQEVGDLLANMKQGSILSNKARRAVFDALYAPKPSEGMATGCISCRTANKTAKTGAVTHDAGIVTHGKHNYVLVIMSKGGTTAQIAQITKAIEAELNP